MNQKSMTVDVNDLRGHKVIDPQGDKVGTIDDVYIDDDTHQPEWLAVTTGLFGTKISFVPVTGISLTNDGDVVVGYDKGTIKDAPRMEANGRLEQSDERELYSYYGREYEFGQSSGRDASGRGTTQSETVMDKDRQTSMLRSEEELSVDKRRQESGRVKLRKWVETEDVHFTVPVQRQKARVVREPVAGRNAASLSDDLGEAEEEIVLSEEVVDVDKRVVGKERVRLDTETVTEQVPVDERVRKERIEVDGDDIDK